MAEPADSPERGRLSSAAHAAAGLGKKIVRSASFGRRRSAARESARRGSESEGSEEAADGERRALAGWLAKRHQHAKGMAPQWASRYFQVDEARGTLSYAKKENKPPSVVLPLADVTSVRGSAC